MKTFLLPPYPALTRLLAAVIWLLAGTAGAAPFENTIAQRTLACTSCHGAQGRAGPDGYYPRLAGKPAGYLYNQLLNFRGGRRHYALMTQLVDPLSDDYLMEIARYFSALDLPYPLPAAPTAAPDVLQRGKALVMQGDAGRPLPASSKPAATLPAGAPGHETADHLDPGQRRGNAGTGRPRLATQRAGRTQRHDPGGHCGRPAGADRTWRLPRARQQLHELPHHTRRHAVRRRPRHRHAVRHRFLEQPDTRPQHRHRPVVAHPFLACHAQRPRSRDGRLLYPAFPYTNYTEITREDSVALYAYLHSLPPAAQPNTPHTLRWPFSTQAALAVWRALYFSPGRYEPGTKQTAEWNRGAYLVRGLGHCSACHSTRNALGATNTPLDLAGGLIPMQNWYAPSLTSASQASVADWAPEHIAALLKTGVSPRGSVLGPMAVFLKSLPPAPVARASTTATGLTTAAGAKLYDQHCAQCHGDQGQGVRGAYPPLAGNRAVTMDSTANLVQIVLNGGYAPATAGNPRPFGMPPFVLVLDDTELATLLTYLRSAWGHQASAVTPTEIHRMRGENQR